MRTLGLIVSTMLMAACGTEKQYQPMYSGSLAAFADSVFSDRPRMTCRGGNRDECFTFAGDTTRYLYADTLNEVVAVGREVTFVGSEAAVEVYNAELAYFTRLLGIPKTCEHGVQLDRVDDVRWSWGDNHVAMRLVIPAEGLHGEPSVTIAHIRGGRNCREYPTPPYLG